MTPSSRAISAQGGANGPAGPNHPGGFPPYPPGGHGPGAYGPPPGGYPPPPGAFPPPAPSPGADLKKQATNWLIIAAVSFFFCGGINCLGVIGAILCFLAMQAADQANLNDAESKLKWGKIVIVCGAVLSLVMWASAILYYVVAQAETM